MLHGLDDTIKGTLLCQVRSVDGDGHARGGPVPGIHHVGRTWGALIAIVGRVLGKHARGHDAAYEVLRVVDEVDAHHRPVQRPWRQARAAHIVGHDGNGLRHEVSPGVLVHPEACHLLDLHQSVVLELPDKAQQLQDHRDILQLPTRVQMYRVPAELLDAFGFDHNLQLAHVLREEVDVTDPEPSLLLDHARRPLLVSADRVVFPDIPAEEIVHWLHEVQEGDARQRVQGAVCKPRNSTRTSDVLATADDVALVCPVLAACSHVLHGEGAVTNDDGILPRDDAVVHLIKHAIADFPLKLVLVLVSLLPRDRQIPWVKEDGTGVKDCLVLGLGSRLESSVVELRHLDGLGGELVLVDHVPLRGREHLGHCAGDVKEVHVLHVGAELAVRQNAVLLADRVEVLQEAVAGGPGRVEHRRQGVVHVELEVIGPELRLQLRGGVGLVHPGSPTDPRHAVKDDKVRVLLLEQDHGSLETNVPRADDGLWVLVLRPGLGEGLEANDSQLWPNLVGRVHPPEGAALLGDESDFPRVHARLVRQQV
mmetsp:Transcript_43466/g.117218  ORF Transcript_43466/g.117218 Transcript_43466/m.117218 type:complete len:537 (-) Transcript_43466:538-2148(-)